MRPDHEVSIHIAMAWAGLAQFYEAIDTGSLFLAEAQAVKADQGLNIMLQHYAWLHQWGLLGGSNRFSVVPKMHFAKHAGAPAKYMNPRACWTHKNEDWVGRLATIALSCAHGTASHKLNPKLVRKYVLMFHLRLYIGVYDD